MANTLDFTKLNRNHITVILDDGNDTKLRIVTPSKALSKLLDEVYTPSFLELEVEEQYDRLYGVATAILNRNKENIEIKRSDVESALDDVVDIWTLLNAYRNFIFEEMQAHSKN